MCLMHVNNYLITVKRDYNLGYCSNVFSLVQYARKTVPECKQFQDIKISFVQYPCSELLAEYQENVERGH